MKKHIIIPLVLILIAALGVAVYLVKRPKDEDAQEVTERIVKEVNDTDKAEKEDVLNGITIPNKNLDWDALHEENKDIYAWVYVPDCDVDYPIVQHESDDAYYLNHNIDGSSGYPGTIYTEPSYTNKDFTDNNTVIYGHNMNNGSMFAGLHAFEKDEAFEGKHYIFVYTPDNTIVYEVYAAYEYTAIHLLANEDMSNIYVYEEYLDNCFDFFTYTERVCKVRDDIRPQKEDRIITLSTCTNPSNEAYRYLVQGIYVGETHKASEEE